MLALALFASAIAAQTAAEPIPFERLGRALLELAPNANVAPDPNAADAAAELELLRRLAPLHVRLDLGAVELWIPRRVIHGDTTVEAGPKVKNCAPLCDAIAGVEKNWLSGAGVDGGDHEHTKRALDRLRTWTRNLGDAAPSDPGADTAADAIWLRNAFLHASPSTSRDELREFGWVVIVAPERAQYLAVLGAAGLLEPKRRASIWTESARRSSIFAIDSDLLLVPLAYGPSKIDGPPCESHSLSANEQREEMAHSLSHLFIAHVTPTAGEWFAEGLALYDTIRACGADDTLCTGYSVTQSVGTTASIGSVSIAPLGVWRWVSREMSPYRSGASPHFFVKALALAHDKRGFEILDLDVGRPVLAETGPFLRPHASAPPAVARAPDGVKKGFAEFFRAYCGAFVRYLDETRIGNASLLERALAVLRGRKAQPNTDVSTDVIEVLEKLSGKKLGKLDSPDLDLEAAFEQWLLKKS